MYDCFCSNSHWYSFEFPVLPSLASLEKELINLLNSGNVDESFFEEADLDPKIISHINMPYAVVQDTFKNSIDDKIELIKEKHRRMTSNKGFYISFDKIRKVNKVLLVILRPIVSVHI